MDFRNENGVLIARRNGETLRIEAWGKDSLRVRATMFSKFTGNNWALTEAFEKGNPVVEITGEEVYQKSFPRHCSQILNSGSNRSRQSHPSTRG